MDINTISLNTKESAEVAFETAQAKVRIKTPKHEEGFGLLIKNSSSSSAKMENIESKFNPKITDTG